MKTLGAEAPRSWIEEISSLPAVTPARSNGPAQRLRIAVASGKGGVGKTLLSSSLALALSGRGTAPVIAVDVDLGGANLHTCLGIERPDFALNRFVLEGARLGDLIAPSGHEGLLFVGGASDIIGVSEFDEAARARFERELTELSEGIFVLDLGAGSSLFNLDLFCLADHGILVTTPEPTAVQNAYGFLRAAVYRRIQLLFDGEDALREMVIEVMNHRSDDEAESVSGLVKRVDRYNREAAGRIQAIASRFSLGLVVNMSSSGEAAGLAANLATVVSRYLGARIDPLGHVPWDESVRRAIRAWRPLLVDRPRSKAARRLREIAGRVAARLSPVPG